MKDKKAEELEAKGLYRRAAKRWAEVMRAARTVNEQREAQAHHDRCMAATKRSPPAFENFADVKQAATEAQIRMGINSKDGRGFNDPHYSRRRKDSDCE